MGRSCADCTGYVTWEENGQWVGDCARKPSCDQEWRFRLEDWGFDPGQYCGQYEFYDAQAEADAIYESVVEDQELARKFWEAESDKSSNR